jgi:23S rRNA (guanine745-N1)-methyltransferase
MMRPTYPNNMACPLDSTALVQQQGQLCCAQGHCFDIARHGYVNLLPVQHKKTKQPGDNKEMVAARTQFLHTGIYQPIADKLNNTLLSLLTEAERTYCILDAGCGDGYYLDEAIKMVTQKNLIAIGVDISKYAIMAAAKRNAQLTWLVGSNKQLPVLPNSIDVILSVFGFPSIDGFTQALNTQGNVILVEPNSQHLIELRKLLYEEIEEAPNKNKSLEPSLFDLIGIDNLTYKTKPLNNTELVNLLKMTPHFYRAPKDAIERVCEQSDISVTVDVSIMVCAKRAMVDEQ